MRTSLMIFAPVAIFVASIAMADDVESRPAADQPRDQANKNGTEEKPDREYERRYKKHKYRHDDDAAKPPKFSHPSAPDVSAPPRSDRN